MNNFKKFKEYLLIKKIIVILRGISVNNFEDYIDLLIILFLLIWIFALILLAKVGRFGGSRIK